MLSQKAFGDGIYLAVYDDPFAGNQSLITGMMGIAGGNDHGFTGSQMIGIVVDMIDAAAGF